MRAVRERPFPRRRCAIPAQHENRQIIVLRDDAGQLVHDRDSIHVRHVQIQQDQVRLELQEDWYYAAGVVEASHMPVPLQFENGSQNPQILWLIVHDQDSGFGEVHDAQTRPFHAGPGPNGIVPPRSNVETVFQFGRF